MTPAFAQQALNNQNFQNFLAGLPSMSPSANNFIGNITEKLATLLPKSDALHAMNDALVAQGKPSALAARSEAAKPAEVKLDAPEMATSSFSKLSM